MPIHPACTLRFRWIYLRLAFGRKVSRGRMASMLWNESADVKARASCRHAVSEITIAMGALAEEVIVPRRGTISLNANACWIDALALLEPSSHDASVDLARLCDGKLLDGLDGLSKPFDHWLASQRTRATETLRALLEPPPTWPSAQKVPALTEHRESHPHRPLPGRNRLRVAVMPFEAKGTQREETLAASLSHEISAALARAGDSWGGGTVVPSTFSRIRHPRPLEKHTTSRRFYKDKV